MNPNPTVVVIGAGPGVGAAVARRFARDGLDVGMIGLPGAALDDLGSSLARDLTGEGLAVRWAGADLTDSEQLTEAVVRLAGPQIAVLHFNPSAWRERDPLELSPDELLADVHLGVGALLTAVQAARPFLHRGARITATGSMAADEPWHRAASLGVQKAGLRNLVHSLDATLAPGGVRAVSVTVRGALAPDDASSPFHPLQVADALHAAAHQDEAHWRSEVGHPSA
jgi:NAD(P)-dependent dehydrogenase (short-subunit alcohol dehydrogenase family)